MRQGVEQAALQPARVRALPDEVGAIRQAREEVRPMATEVLVDRLLGVQAEIFADQFHRDHLAIRQQRQRAALAPLARGEMGFDKIVNLAEHGNDQFVELHWVLRPLV